MTAIQSPASAAKQIDQQLSAALSNFYDDPLGFVDFAYPWGKPGILKDRTGPDEVQAEILQDIAEEVKKRPFDGHNPVSPIQVAIASGHGVGKSTVAAWLVDWIMCTRPNAQGTITANTFRQLESKTWAQIQKWTKLLICSHWFNVTSSKMYRIGSGESWSCSTQTCKEDNSESFAGQHAADSTSFYIFDEASNIPDEIFNVAKGGLTDGAPMIFLFGNPTKKSGKFYRCTHGSERGKWVHKAIDSRKSSLTNHEELAKWVAEEGIDSDFVRVRVLGLPPNAETVQFIDNDRVSAAQMRQVVSLRDQPLVAGVDMAWGGEDSNVIRFRCGQDARSIPPIKIAGERTRDAQVLVTKLSDVLSTDYAGRRVKMMFLDSAGIAGAVVPRLRELGFNNVIEVNFGADSPDEHYANQRAFMWGQLKEWLLTGGIDKDPQLEVDLTAPWYKHDTRTRILLEAKDKMKLRGYDSPDDGDALALTFAMKVTAPKPLPKPEYTYPRQDPQRWLGW